MKKIIGFLIFLFSVGLTQPSVAQIKNNLRGVDKVTFYGVDFSFAKIYGSDDDFYKLQNAFAGINELFETEPKKYDISRALGIRRVDLYNSQIIDNVYSIRENLLFTNDSRYYITDKEIYKVVRRIRKEGNSRYGVVIVAGLLNKSTNQGTFTYVVFEQRSNRVIVQKELSGKAKGFGLRNYWAGALYETMKKVK